MTNYNRREEWRVIRDEIQNADDGDFSPLNDFLTESMSKMDEIELKKKHKSVLDDAYNRIEH